VRFSFPLYDCCVVNTGWATKTVTLVLLAVIASTKVPASEIYSWVDGNGVPHYSQYRPAVNTPNVIKQTLEDTAPPGNGQLEDVYDVEAQAKRMAAWREERERKREEARGRKRQAAQQQAIEYSEPNRRFARSFWNPPFYNRPPYRPPNKPRPPVVEPGPPSFVFPRGGSH